MGVPCAEQSQPLVSRRELSQPKRNQSRVLSVPAQTALELPLARPSRLHGRRMHGRAVTANVSIPSVGDILGRRIYIEDIYPLVDAGRFPVKRIVNEPVEIWADIFRDGHAVLAADLLWRP